MKTITLTRHIAIEDFDRAYWLKQQLVDFCRQHGLPTGGAKRELTERIRTFLLGGNVPRAASREVRTGKMPDVFQHETVIGRNWRCSQALRAFFEREIGPKFHFNAILREFIEHGEGKTLQEAIDAWFQEEQEPCAEKSIAPQFEYNRHIREFFQQHPGATLQDAIPAWNRKKAQRNKK